MVFMFMTEDKAVEVKKYLVERIIFVFFLKSVLV